MFTTERKRVGDVMIVTTVETTPAIIDFHDIVKKAVVESDDDMGAPWDEQCDYGHTATLCTPESEPGRFADKLRRGEQGTKMVDGSFWVYHYNPEHIAGRRHAEYLIEINDIRETQYMAVYDYARDHGASRQVAKELMAETLAGIYEQICTWYDLGWQWWWVGIKFMDEEESMGGILCEEGDEHLDEMALDLAEDVARKLIALGYTVTNMPVHGTREEKQRSLQTKIAYNLGFNTREAYLKRRM